MQQSTQYKYDIAFSLCQQDVDIARKIIAHLNPGLKIFFYENNQEDLITQSGPEAFSKVFKEEARIVVILSRKEWSKSFYTELERNAIIDRTSIQSQGYDFLFLIPIVPNEAPVWYPSTRIYASLQRFTIENIAKFIEFKVTDQGGEIEPVDLNVMYQHLTQKIVEKKQLIDLQYSKEALNQINVVLQQARDAANDRVNTLMQNSIGETDLLKYDTLPNFQIAFSLGSYMLEIVVSIPNEMYQKITTTQDYNLAFKISQFGNKMRDVINDPQLKSVITTETYKYLYSSTTKGWCKPYILDKVSKEEEKVLFNFRDPNNLHVTFIHYDLKDPVDSETLVDNWFQLFLKYAASKIERYL